MVEAQGGKILSGVSSKLNYLVVGEDAGSKLEKAKKIPSIKILSEKEFLQFIGWLATVKQFSLSFSLLFFVTLVKPQP